MVIKTKSATKFSEKRENFYELCEKLLKTQKKCVILYCQPKILKPKKNIFWLELPSFLFFFHSKNN